MDMYFFTQESPRSLDTLLEDFKTSAGNFNRFYSEMNEREKHLFKGYLHSLRVATNSPNMSVETETTSAELF